LKSNPSSLKEESILDNDRRTRGLSRLAELNDEPGGETFLARMGDLGDYIVDFAFGDIHCREGLSVREREIIILTSLITLGGCEPQVKAHIRSLKAIGVTDKEIEEMILQILPYAGTPRVVNAMKVLREEQEVFE
jgi:4-carboxymuconolactone decarboxylase